jgi:hypothetical protein
MVIHGLATFTDQDFLMNEEEEEKERIIDSSSKRVNDSIKKKTRKRDLTTK